MQWTMDMGHDGGFFCVFSNEVIVYRARMYANPLLIVHCTGSLHHFQRSICLLQYVEGFLKTKISLKQKLVYYIENLETEECRHLMSIDLFNL